MDRGRTERVVEAILTQISSGHLKPRERVLSIRDAARRFGVSKNTVVEAYDRLVARSVLEARQGAGFFVVHQPRDHFPGTTAAAHVAAATDHISLLREQLDKSYSVRVGDGRPPSEWSDGSEIGRHLRVTHLHLKNSEHGYGTPQGYEPLRSRIAQILIERGIHAHPRQVLLTFGANHGLDLIVRHFIEAGDAVIVESPGYYPLFGKLRLQRANILAVPRGADGPDLEAIDTFAAAHRPRLVFVQTLAQNPTGLSMPLGTMHRLLQLAEKHGFLIVENDPLADILPAMMPRLGALDQLKRVIYVGTFSKTLSASLRSGYLAASAEIIASLTDIKMLSVVNSCSPAEKLICDLIESGQYRRHLRRLQLRIERAAEATSFGLRNIGFDQFTAPAGGFYLWLRLPTGMDDIRLAQQAADRSIFLAPSSIFSFNNVGYEPALRINVAYGNQPQFHAFLTESKPARKGA